MRKIRRTLSYFVSLILIAVNIFALFQIQQTLSDFNRIDSQPIMVYIQPENRKIEPDIVADIVTEPETETSNIPRYGFTDDEIYLMAVLLSGSKNVDGDGEYDIDFSNEDNTQQIALVLSVVMNRVRSEQFPNTVTEVIWASGQFSPMTRWANGLPEVSDAALEKVRLWCEAYDNYNPYVQQIPDTHLYFWGNGIINTSRERWYS